MIANTRETARRVRLFAAAFLALSATTAHADPKAQALLEKVQAANEAARTMTADLTYAVTSVKRTQRAEGTVKLMRPNAALITFSQLIGAPFTRLIASDGTTVWKFDPKQNTYQKQAVNAQGKNIRLWDAAPIQAFFDVPSAMRECVYVRDPDAVKHAGEETVNGVNYQVLEHRMQGLVSGGESSPFTHRLYIGPDYLIHKHMLLFQSGGQPGVQVAELSNIKTNVAMTAAEFSFKPPAGATINDLDEPGPPQTTQTSTPPTAPRPTALYYDSRLRVGAAPFDFTAHDLSDRLLSLEQYRGKVVLLDFWATWCGTCIGEVPNIVSAYKKYKAQGFDIVGISLDEDRSKLLSFIQTNKMPWRQVFDGHGWNSLISTRYKVRSIPFTLLIGRDGKIAAVNLRGAALEPAIQAALAQK